MYLGIKRKLIIILSIVIVIVILLNTYLFYSIINKSINNKWIDQSYKTNAIIVHKHISYHSIYLIFNIDHHAKNYTTLLYSSIIENLQTINDKYIINSSISIDYNPISDDIKINQSKQDINPEILIFVLANFLYVITIISACFIIKYVNKLRELKNEHINNDDLVGDINL